MKKDSVLKEMKRVEKEISDLDRGALEFTKKLSRILGLEYLAMGILVLAIILGLIGLYLFPSGTPETKAVLVIAGSGMLLGLGGVLVSIASIMYGLFGMNLSLFIYKLQKVKEDYNKVKKELGAINRGLSK